MGSQSEANHKTIRSSGSAGRGSSGWLLFLLLFLTALVLPRLIAGPFSVVGVLGDIGDYSVPYFMMAASDIGSFGNGFLPAVPMGNNLYEIGIHAPAQLFLFAVFPGWLANGLNWLWLTLAAATSLYLLAERHFHLSPEWATLVSLIGGASIINGNFGYAVVALVPLVLFLALEFLRKPAILRGLLLVVTAVLLGLWVPVKFLVLFPALVLTISILTLGDGRFRWRIVACLLVILSIYSFRTGDIADYLMATVTSDRGWIVERQPVGRLLLLGAEYAFEYVDPRVLFELRPWPQTNPTCAAFWLIIAAILLRAVTGRFRRLLWLILGLAALQVVFPVIWQWVLFDLLEMPGLYFHPKLWRPVMPLLYIGAGCAAAGLAARYGAAISAKLSDRMAGRLVHAPLAVFALVVALQSYGSAARSWVLDGSFRALYQDYAIGEVARTVAAEPLPPRSVILDKPNGFLAAYGLRTPLGRTEWLPHRFAVLMRAAGLLPEAGRDDMGYQSASLGPTMLLHDALMTGSQAATLRNFLALTSVEWIFSRTALPEAFFVSQGEAEWSDWSSYDLRQRIEHSIASNLSGHTALAAFRNIQALPTVYSVTRYAIADTAAEAAGQILAQPAADLHNFAVIERDNDFAASSAALSKVIIHRVSGHLSDIVLQVEGSGQGLLVVTEPIDHGWRYLIDGAPAEVIAVNAAFVGLPVPPGEHQLVLQRTLID